MGNSLSGLCGSDIFQQLKNKYGQEFVKLIIAQKAKDAITLRFGQVATQLDGIFNDGKMTTTTMVNEKTNFIIQLFNKFKTKVQSMVPGGIKIVEQLKGQPIEQIVGFNKLLLAITQIQNRAVAQISTKQGVIIEELRTRQQNFIQNINDQKPKLPLYDQLPEAIQRQILHKGEEIFMSQIQSRREEIMKQIDNQISLDKVKDVIKQLIPRQQLNVVSDNAQSSFSSTLSTLLNTGLSSGGQAGGVYGIANALGGIFGSTANSSLNNIANSIPFLNFGGSNNTYQKEPVTTTTVTTTVQKNTTNPTKQQFGYNENNLFL